MGSLGFSELLLILIIVLVVFGATKLPQLGDGLGKAIKNFKRAMAGQDEIEVTKKKGALAEDEEKRAGGEAGAAAKDGK